MDLVTLVCDRWGSINRIISKNLLFEYCDKYEMVPKVNTIYKNHNIGNWLHNQKKKIN